MVRFHSGAYKEVVLKEEELPSVKEMIDEIVEMKEFIGMYVNRQELENMHITTLISHYKHYTDLFANNSFWHSRHQKNIEEG